MLLVALAMGFVACEPSNYSDRKYQNKLEGEWNMTLIKGTLSSDDKIIQEVSKSLPDKDTYQSITFNFKKDRTYEINAVIAGNGESECEMGKYSVVDGKLALYEPDDPDEPVYFDIVDISNKNLILLASESTGAGLKATYELHFDKL
jgi:hypothetical protein